MPTEASCSSSLISWRRSAAMFLASLSFLTTSNTVPAVGTSAQPMISTGSDGPAVFRRSPRSFIIALTRPLTDPATNASDCFSVPRLTITVAVGPMPCSSWDSTTTPTAVGLGFALYSWSCAMRSITSSRLSTPSPVRADTSTDGTSPPSSSTMTSCCVSSVLTRSGSAPGRSDLLMATTNSTPAALA